MVLKKRAGKGLPNIEITEGEKNQVKKQGHKRKPMKERRKTRRLHVCPKLTQQ